jgi:hypothetical protein
MCRCRPIDEITSKYNTLDFKARKSIKEVLNKITIEGMAFAILFS